LKVAILGAGSVGCFIGAAWAKAGVDVTLIGRASIGDMIAEHGLTLTAHDGWRARFAPGELDFTTKPTALRDADIIALATKSHGTEGAAKAIGRHAKKDALVLTFQNGIGSAERVAALTRNRFRTAAGMVPFNVAWMGSGRLHKGVAGDLAAADLPATRALAALVEESPARLRLFDDMDAIAWGKLLINLNNAVNALSGLSLLQQLRQRDYRRVVAASQVEALALLEAAGITPAKIGPVPPNLLPHALAAPDILFNKVFLKAQKIDAQARSSMQDDLALGRKTEVGDLNGEVVALAGRLGRKAPVNQAIVTLVEMAEAGVHQPWPADKLREHVLEKHKPAPGFGY